MADKDNLSNFLVPIDDQDIKVCIDSCFLCQSAYREEAEEMYDKYDNIKRVHKFLTEDRQEQVSYQAVRNHLQFHHKSPQNSAMIREYGKDISKWQVSQEDSKAGLLRSIAILEREMFTIASQSESLTLAERRRNADMVKKLADSILTHRHRLDEINSENEPIVVVFQQLQLIIQEEIKKTNSSEVKNAVKHIMKRLEDGCRDIIIG